MAEKYTPFMPSREIRCILFVVCIAAVATFMGCAQKDSPSPEDAFNTLRFTQARWVDLDYVPCTLNDDDLFPVAQCDGDDPETPQRKLDALMALESSLPPDLDATSTPADLRLHARVEALSGTQVIHLRRARDVAAGRSAPGGGRGRSRRGVGLGGAAFDVGGAPAVGGAGGGRLGCLGAGRWR